jgi:hypothetical protein
MRKGIATEIVARRLGVRKGRADGLVQSASDGGALPKASGRDIPDLSESDMVALFLAITADRGLGNAPQSVRTFSGLTNDRGDTLADTLAGLFSRGPALASLVSGSLIVRLDPPGVALSTSAGHHQFGPEPPPGAAAKVVLVPGRTLAAIGLELQGRSPDEADSLVALARVSRSLSLSLAFDAVPA